MKNEASISRYRLMIGTGGIGSGVFFALDGNHTLGREESRGGRFLDKRDYCKLHIISHYVKMLLGPYFPTILVGKVGDDDVGRQLLAEMQDTQLDLHYVRIVPGVQTLFSTCIIYPDGSGGNLTTSDSASAQVVERDIDQAEKIFMQYQGQGIALSAPEVPLEARARLLELGSRYRFWRVASLTSAEMHAPLAVHILEHTDLLAINLDEAAALAGLDVAKAASESIFEAAVARLQEIQPLACLAVTVGKEGSWTWDSNQQSQMTAIDVPVRSTAGAGDAFLAGLIAGKAADLGMAESQHLATLAASYSVTSPHTIHPGLDRESLLRFVKQRALELPQAVVSFLESGLGIVSSDPK